MKAFFSKMLELAMGGTPEQPFLALVAAPNAAGLDSEHPSGSYAFPADFFPPTCQVQSIPQDDSFIENLRKAVSERAPSRIMLVPPFCSHRHLPERLRQAFPRLNYEEIALSVVADAV